MGLRIIQTPSHFARYCYRFPMTYINYYISMKIWNISKNRFLDVQ